MASNSPRVTVFMPVYNRAQRLPAAIESVLAQTFGDFELLIVDDGSDDASLEVIRSYDDPRIRLVEQKRNQGIPRTRNRGIDEARGDYLAHADSDDYVYPTRLAKQFAFLEQHAEVAAAGCWMSRMDEGGKLRRGPLVRPTDSREIRGRILFATCFKNPTMMARTDVLRQFRFREELSICSDIDLWGRISSRYPLANLPEVLMCYRAGGVSHADATTQRRMRERIARGFLEEFPFDFTESDVAAHVQLRNLSGFAPDEEFCVWADRWLLRLVDANARSGLYPEPEFTRAAAERWLLLSFRSRRIRDYKNGRRVGSSLRVVAGGWPGYLERKMGWLSGTVRRPSWPGDFKVHRQRLFKES